jgi:hypothetical protein
MELAYGCSHLLLDFLLFQRPRDRSLDSYIQTLFIVIQSHQAISAGPTNLFAKTSQLANPLEYSASAKIKSR